jgi:hypothetical protein
MPPGCEYCVRYHHPRNVPFFQLPVHSCFECGVYVECSIQQSTKFGHTQIIQPCDLLIGKISVNRLCTNPNHQNFSTCAIRVMRLIENRPGKCAGRLCLRLSQDDWQVEVIVSLHIERRRRRGRIAYYVLRRYGNGVRAKRQHSRRYVNQLPCSSNKSRGNNLPIQSHLHRGWVDAYSGVCDQRADDRQRVGNSGTVRGCDARNLWRRNIIAERKCLWFAHFFEGIRELSAVCHQFEWLFQIFAGALGNLLPLWGSHPKTSRFLGLKWGE